MSSNNYLKYRGKCKELSNELEKKNPDLIVVKGWYHCPIWGKQQHYWCKNKKTGEIVDPSVKQFPSSMYADESFYEEYNGFLYCEFCNKTVKETDAKFYIHHVYCSTECLYKDIGLQE
jgi:hypothetical protein